MLAVALVTLYADNHLFDADRFADQATTALEEPAVQASISRRVTDAIVATEPDLTGSRPLLEGAIAVVAQSRPFHQLFRGVAADLHRSVFGAEKDTVALTLADVGVLVVEALRAFAPGLAKKVPADIEPRLLSLTDTGSGLLTDGAQIAEDVGYLWLLALGLSLALGATAMVIAPDRRRAARNAALVASAAGVLCVLAVEVGRELLAGRLVDHRDAAAARALWDVMVLDLRAWAAVVAAGGLLIAAATASLVRPVPMGVWARRAWSVAATVPGSARGRAVRGAALIAAGLALLLARDLVVTVVVLAAAGLLLYSGAVELLRLLFPPLAPTAARERRSVRRLRLPRWAGATILVALGVGTAVAVAASVVEPERSRFAIRSCNGSAALCDRPVEQVSFPATHNSMSAADQRGWLFAQQEQGIPDQLEAGVRGLLIDTHWGIATDRGVYTVLEPGSASRTKIDDPLGGRFVAAAEQLRERIGYRGGGRREIFLCHAFCETGARRASLALDQIRDFLVKNPSEVLMLSIENDIALEPVARALADSGLRDLTWEGELQEGRMPTLRQMIEADRRVIVMVWQRGPLGPIGFERFPWLHRQFALVQETPYEFKSVAALESRQSCKLNGGLASNPLFLLNHWVDSSPYFLPSNARRVNARGPLLRRARECERARERLPNLIAVDFFRQGDLLGVVRELNERPRPAAASRPSARRLSPRGPPTARASASAALQRRHRQPRLLELLPVVLGRLLLTRPDDRLAGVVDLVGDSVPGFEREAGDDPRERGRDPVEGVVVVVEHDHPPVAAEIVARTAHTRSLDGLCPAHGRDAGARAPSPSPIAAPSRSARLRQ